MPTTSNFGWTTPADTDLVKDGAAAIRTLGNGIDTSLVDLKGGTTGQVLSKATNTDLDFTWVAQDDSNAIQNAIVDAKGDLITATAADTPARLAVGTNGQYLQADSTTSTGLKWATVSAGGMTELASGTLSGSAVDLTGISGSYRDLRLIIRGFRASTDNGNARFRLNSDSNANRYVNITGPGQSTGIAIDQNLLNVAIGNDDTVGTGFIMLNLRDYANTSTWKFVEINAILNNSVTSSNLNYSVDYYGIYNQTGAITAINLFPNTGTFSAGNYILYGMS